MAPLIILLHTRRLLLTQSAANAKLNLNLNANGNLFQPRFPGPIRAAYFGTSKRCGYARKESQERDSIDTESMEYSQTGTDDQAAHQDVAFDPSTTDPKAEREKGNSNGEKRKGDGGGNPLDVSPANPNVSKGTGKE